MKRRYGLVLPLLLVLVPVATAAEHRAEALAEAPPSDQLDEAIVSQLAGEGVRIVRGKSTKLCDIWLRENPPVREGFTPTLSELYPFEVGELIGVVRYHRRGEDFRAQEIPDGVYTLRYALQPVDGNHVGTSDTRDFLLLLPAESDTSADTMEEMSMWDASAEAVGTSHPAMLSMLPVTSSGNELPTIEHNEEFDQWSVIMQPKTEAGDLTIRLIVVGHSPE